MLILTLAALSISATAFHGEPLVCPVNGAHEADMKRAFRDYNGVRYWTCCGDCEPAFDKEPGKYAKAREEGKAAGVFLFDPVSGARLLHDKAIKEYSDYKGIRFLFASIENKSKFDGDPKRYGTLPQKEALYCSPGKEALESYAASSGYVDFKGVRYYMCCAGCEKPWAKEPEKHAANSERYVKTPGIATEKPKAKKDGG